MKTFSTPLLLILALSLPAPAVAEMYRWTDASGTLHITDNLANVPPQQRIAARSRKPSEIRAVQRYASLKTRRSHVAALSISSLRRSSPGQTASVGQEIRIPFEREGNLMKIKVRLNDHVVAPFYVDTGASDISLPRSVGTQLGVSAGSETGMATEVTASGTIQVPVIKLDSVQVGGARIENLLATINPMLEVGLLGGSFFNNFSYSINTVEGILILRPN
ncbi:MAG: retroviral-like aspartic protease family protein [Gemmatimonadota bacterium]